MIGYSIAYLEAGIGVMKTFRCVQYYMLCPIGKKLMHKQSNDLQLYSETS